MVINNMAICTIFNMHVMLNSINMLSNKYPLKLLIEKSITKKELLIVSSIALGINSEYIAIAIEGDEEVIKKPKKLELICELEDFSKTYKNIVTFYPLNKNVMNKLCNLNAFTEVATKFVITLECKCIFRNDLFNKEDIDVTKSYTLLQLNKKPIRFNF